MARGRSVVVFEADGCRLRGTTFAREGDTLSMRATAESRSLDARDALREVVAALRAAGGEWPRTAAVLSAEAVAATVRLPLPHGKPRRPDEMGELVRWELEPYFAQHSGSQPLGAILMRRGLLSEAQLAEVVAEQRHRGDGARLGTLAIEFGFLGAPDLEDALAIQRRPSDVSGGYRCGWSLRGVADPDEPAASRWFVTGLPASSWQRWREALAGHDLALTGIYPLAGSASASASRLPPRCALVEVDAASVSCAELRDGEVCSFQEMPRSDGEALERVVEDLLAGVNGQPVFVTGADPSRFSADARELEPSGTDVAMQGVARHALGLAPPGAAVRVPGRLPRPPLRTRPFVWWLGAGAAVALLLFGLDSLLVARRDHWREEHARLKAPLERADRKRVNERALAERSYSLGRQLDEVAGETEETRVRAERLRRAMKGRCRIALPLLDALARSVNGEVVLWRVESVADGRVRLRGWAARERGIQHFTSKVATHAEPLGFRVERQVIRADERSRAGGYSFEFELTRIESEEPR
jgi:hypothetical protein